MLVLVVVQIISNCWIELFSFCLSKCQSCKSISSGAQYATLQKYFSAVNWPLQYFLDEVLQKSTLHLILARKTAHVHSTLQEHLEQDHFAETNLHVLTFLLPILIGRVTYRALVELL